MTAEIDGIRRRLEWRKHRISELSCMEKLRGACEDVDTLLKEIDRLTAEVESIGRARDTANEQAYIEMKNHSTIAHRCDDLKAQNTALREALEPLVDLRKLVKSGDPCYDEMDGDISYTVPITKDSLEAAKAAGEE